MTPQLARFGSLVVMRSSTHRVSELIRRTEDHNRDIVDRFCSTMGTVPIVTFGPTDLLLLSLGDNLQLLDAAVADGAPAYRRADGIRELHWRSEDVHNDHTGVQWRTVDHFFSEDAARLGSFLGLVQLRLSPLYHLASQTTGRRERVFRALDQLMSGGSQGRAVSLAARAAGHLQAPLLVCPFLGLDRTELFLLVRSDRIDDIAHFVHSVRDVRLDCLGGVRPDVLTALTDIAAADVENRWSRSPLWHGSHTILGAQLRAGAHAQTVLSKPPNGPEDTAWQEAFVHTPAAASASAGQGLEVGRHLQFAPSATERVLGVLQERYGFCQERMPGPPDAPPVVERFVFGRDQLSVPVWARSPDPPADSDPRPAPSELTVGTLLYILSECLRPWTRTDTEATEASPTAAPDVHISTTLQLRKVGRADTGSVSIDPPSPVEQAYLDCCRRVIAAKGARLPADASHTAQAPDLQDEARRETSWVRSIRASAARLRLPWGLKHTLVDITTSLLSRLEEDPELAAVGMLELAATEEALFNLAKDGPNPVRVRRASDLWANRSRPIAHLQRVGHCLGDLVAGGLSQGMLGEPSSGAPIFSVHRVGQRYTIDALVALARGLGDVIGLGDGVPLIRWTSKPRARAMVGHAGGLILELPASDRLELLDLGLQPAIFGAALDTLRFRDLSAVTIDPAASDAEKEGSKAILAGWMRLSRRLGLGVPPADAVLGSFLSMVGARIAASDTADAGTDVRLSRVFQRICRGLPCLLAYHLFAPKPDGLSRPGVFSPEQTRPLYFQAGPVAIRELLAGADVASVHYDSVATGVLGLLLFSWLVDRRLLERPPEFARCLESVLQTLHRTAAFENALDNHDFEVPERFDPDLAERWIAFGQDLGLGAESLLIPTRDLLAELTARQEVGRKDTAPNARVPFNQQLAGWLELVDALTLAPTAAPALRAAMRHAGHAPPDGVVRRTSMDHRKTVQEAWTTYVDTLAHDAAPARAWYPFTDEAWPSERHPDGTVNTEFADLAARSSRRWSGSRLWLRTGGRSRLQPAPHARVLITSLPERTLLDALWAIGGPDLGEVLKSTLELDASQP